MVVQIKNCIVVVLICILTLLAGCGSDDTQVSENSEPTATVSEVVAPTATPTVAAEATPTDHHTSEHNASATNSEAQPAATESTDDVVMLDIDMHDSYYGDSDTNISDPPVWTAKTGQTVLVNLVNHGSMRHNWAIVKLDSNVPASFDVEKDSSLLLAEPGMVYANSQTQWVFRAPEPGEYMVICTVNSHYPTMQGKLIVTDE